MKEKGVKVRGEMLGEVVEACSNNETYTSEDPYRDMVRSINT